MKRIICILVCICTILCSLSLFSCQKKDPEGPVAYVLGEKGSAYSLGLAESFKLAFEEKGGTVTMETFPAGTTSFSEYFTKAIDVEADVIFLPNSVASAPDLLKTAKDMEISVPILAGDTWESPVILESVKDSGLNVYCATFFDEADTNDAAAEFVSGFKKYVTENSEYYEMNGSTDMVAAVSALGFDAYNVAMDAIRLAADEKGENFTSIDVAKTLWSTDHNGVAGNIVFDENGDAIKNGVYIKKALSDGSGFESVKLQTVENGAKKGSSPEYGGEGISIDTDNKRITVGVFEPTTGDNMTGGKQELLGIIYANHLDNTVTVDGEEYEVVLSVSDNGSLTEYALATATKLAEDKCVVVIGSYGSGVSIAAADVFEGACLPAIGASCTSTDVTFGNDYYFRATVTDPFESAAIADFAMNIIESEKE